MRQRFIQSFPTSQDIQSALVNKELGNPYVALAMDEQRLVWNKDIDHILPLTFEVTDAGTIVWKKNESNAPAKTIQYSINNGSWQSITANDTAGTEINVSVGDVVQFKGNNTSYASDIANSCSLAGTAKYYAYGNIMSLIHGDNFIDKTTLTETFTFPRLFYRATGLKSHSTHKLVLPATTLTDYCYRNIFEGCTSLTTAPELPATTLAEGCYEGMFYGCTSLTQAPELPATTLATACYGSMFRDCTSLTQAPALPATTLAINCYQGIFFGCTSLTQAPELLAATLVSGCYSDMFGICSNLSYVKCLAIDLSTNSNTAYWLDRVASSGTFVKHPNATWTTGTSGIPKGWTVEDATV